MKLYTHFILLSLVLLFGRTALAQEGGDTSDTPEEAGAPDGVDPVTESGVDDSAPAPNEAERPEEAQADAA